MSTLKTRFSALLDKARYLALAFATAAAVLTTGLLATAPMPADAAVSIATATRNARCTAIVTAAGSSAQLRIYSGARPANANTAASGTLLATVTFGSTIGTCTSGALDYDEAGATQSAGSHVSGTPGYARLQTSGGTAIFDIDVCGAAPCWTFTGTVVNGQNVTLTTLSFTEGNT